MSITKYNRGKKFDVNLTDAVTVKLAALVVGDVYPISAIMFTEKGKFGKSAFVVTKVGDNVAVVYLPKHKVKECEDILTESVLVQDIIDGKVGIVPRTYEDEEGATRFTINFWRHGVISCRHIFIKGEKHDYNNSAIMLRGDRFSIRHGAGLF